MRRLSQFGVKHLHVTLANDKRVSPRVTHLVALFLWVQQVGSDIRKRLVFTLRLWGASSRSHLRRCVLIDDPPDHVHRQETQILNKHGCRHQEGNQLHTAPAHTVIINRHEDQHRETQPQKLC